MCHIHRAQYRFVRVDYRGDDVKRRHAKLIIILLAGMILSWSLIGCFKDTDLGIETKPDVFGIMSLVRYSVHSNKTKFNIDNVTLDFYFGGHANGNLNPFYFTDIDAQFVCFALHFFDSQHYKGALYNLGIICDDYRSIHDYYLIKTLTYDEFNSDEYGCKLLNGKLVFNHHELLTVPKEVFEMKSGSFYFQITEIWFSQVANQYGTVINNSIFINYDYIDEQTIRLSKPVSLT